MTKVCVCIDPQAKFVTDIDLGQDEWSDLLPDNLPPFRLEESRKPCIHYPDGIFPGSDRYMKDYQITTVSNFSNFIEYSRIVPDEVVTINGVKYLTTRFYERRTKGWSSPVPDRKDGRTLGYCVSGGDVYSVEDYETVYQIFYLCVYKRLLMNNRVFMKLMDIVNDHICVFISGADIALMNILKSILLESIVQ